MQNFLNKTRQFLSGTIEELHKCSWPKREELYESTIVVIVAIILMALFVFLVDLAGQKIISFLTGF